MTELFDLTTALALMELLPVRIAMLVASLLGVAWATSVDAALGGVTEAVVRGALEGRRPNARQLAFWIEMPGRILVALSIVRLSCVATFLLVTLWLARTIQSDSGEIALGIAATLLLLEFGLLLPRVLGKRYAVVWATATIRIVRIVVFCLFPVIWPLLSLMRALASWIGVHPGSRSVGAFWTPEEFQRLLARERTRALDGSNEDLLRSIIEFSDTVIREIMVPRTDVVALSVEAGSDEVRRIVVESGHSRIPVYEDTVDKIVGILYVKDLSALNATAGLDSLDLQLQVRPTFYVPEVMKISELLREFQKRKTHMAIVVDEYGGTAGIVTLEDIIEEIVGEIQDEYDVEEKQFLVVGENKILADGRVSVWDLEEPLGVEFPNSGSYETLAGFLTARAGYLPEKGAVIAWEGLRFTVKEANERRIGRVEIERNVGSDPEASA